MECPKSAIFYSEILNRFNSLHNSNLSHSKEQILFSSDPPSSQLTIAENADLTFY